MVITGRKGHVFYFINFMIHLYHVCLKIPQAFNDEMMRPARDKTNISGNSGPVKPADSPKPYTKLTGKGFTLLWFAIIAFVLFGQSIRFNYTYLDDQLLILGKMERLQSFSTLKSAFSEDVFQSPPGRGYYYRPVLTLSFMADAMIGKGSFAMFHFSNIAYHILATFLLFLFFMELGYDRLRSMLFGLFFLVHPMVTQAVAWVPGRNDTLLAIFIIGSLISWLKYLKKGNKFHLILHLLLWGLALFTKESAIVLPVVIVFYSLTIMRTPLKKFVIAGAGWVILSVTWATIRHHILGSSGEATFFSRILSVIKNLPAILPYLGKTIFPFNLAEYPILADMRVSAVLGIITIGVLIILMWLSKPKQWSLYFFGFLWFIAFLVPSFVSVNHQVPNFSEHRSYISLAGIFLFILGTGPVEKVNFTKWGPISVVIGICLLFSILTFLHVRHFRDQFTFWRSAVDSSPTHAFNYNNLGAMYFLEKDYEKSEPYFRKALEINPSEPMANSNAGLICMNTNRPAEAEKYYLEEIRINPTYDHAYYNLGLLYYNHGRFDEGIRQWEKTLTVNPGYTDAYKALLFAYEKMDRKEDYEQIALKARALGVLP
jgi:hypothetical protein